MLRLMRVVILSLGASLALLGVLPLKRAPGDTPPAKPSLAGQAGTSQPNNDHSATDARPVTQVDFADNQTLAMDSSSPSKYHAIVFLKNDEPVQPTVAFNLTLQDMKGTIVASAASVSVSSQALKPNSVGAIELDFDASQFNPPLAGYLQLIATSSPDHKPSVKYRTVKLPTALPSPVATRLLWLSFGGTILVAFIALVTLQRDGIPINQRMGSPTWSFGDSWGTNIAVAGTVLTPLISFSALPDQTHFLAKSSYVTVSMIFGLVIAFAPSLYSLVRIAVQPPTNPPGPTPAIVFEGYVGFFLLASAVAAWGAVGQVVTIGFLLGELNHNHVISPSVLLCLLAILALVAVFLLVYEFRTIVQVVKSQKDSQTTSQIASARLVQLPPEEAATVVRTPQTLPPWSVF